MPWIGPAIGAAAGLLGGGSSQGGTTTQKNEPWAPAQPWLMNNVQTGQQLQNFYQANPFNRQQQTAYGNLASGTDYMNRLTPGLLAQFGQQGGFDRNNPSARPAPFSFFAPQAQPQSYGGAMQPSAPQARSGGFFGSPAGSPDTQVFDGDAYLKNNPDVAADPYFAQHPQAHYEQYGRKEGRGSPAMAQGMNTSDNPFANGAIPAPAPAAAAQAPRMTEAMINQAQIEAWMGGSDKGP